LGLIGLSIAFISSESLHGEFVRLNLNIFTLLCIVLALPAAHAANQEAAGESGEEVITCEIFLEQFKANPTPRAKLQDLYQQAIAKTKPGEEQKQNSERAKLVMLYDSEIATLEERIQNLGQAFKNEFNWRERINYFSGARLYVAREIAAMELDVREMKKERQQVFRLIPRANILVRAMRAVRDHMNQGRDNLVRSATDALTDKPTNSSEAKFLDPMNPASPYYNLPIGSGRDEDER
jgi:hypothetical protein